MKILYDHQIFSIQKYGGISRYYFELISRFKKDRNIECELACKYSENAYIHSSNLFIDIKDGKEDRKIFEDFLYRVKFKGKTKTHLPFVILGLVSHPPAVLNRIYSAEIILHNNEVVFSEENVLKLSVIIPKGNNKKGF